MKKAETVSFFKAAYFANSKNEKAKSDLQMVADALDLVRDSVTG